MFPYEKILGWLLRLNGLLLMFATFAIFLPTGWMVEIGSWLGLGGIKMQPITIYLARSTSALYAVHGFLTFWIGLQPRKYWGLIPVLAILHIILGGVLLGTDINAGMPMYWTVGEGVPIACFGGFVLWIYSKCDQENQDSQ